MTNSVFGKKWERCQRDTLDVIRRYQNEYLTRMQSRPKWVKKAPSLRVGQLVLVKDENRATTNWSLGRVLEVIQGQDDPVRRTKMYRLRISI